MRKKGILAGLVILLAIAGIAAATDGGVGGFIIDMIISPLGVHFDTINGGGSIPALNSPDQKATFAIGGGETPSLEYHDHGSANPLDIVEGKPMLVVATADEKMGAIIGYAEVNGKYMPFISFVEDNGEPGKDDVFEIAVPEWPYLNGAKIQGNIQIGNGNGVG